MAHNSFGKTMTDCLESVHRRTKTGTCLCHVSILVLHYSASDVSQKVLETIDRVFGNLTIFHFEISERTDDPDYSRRSKATTRLNREKSWSLCGKSPHS